MGLLNIGTSMCLKTSKQECGRGPKPGHRGIWPKPSGISNFLFIFPIPLQGFLCRCGPHSCLQLKETALHSRPVWEEAGLSCLAWMFSVLCIHQVASGEKTKCTYRYRCLWVSGACRPQATAPQKLTVSISAKPNCWRVGCLTTF